MTTNDADSEEPLLHPARKADPDKKRPKGPRGDIDLLLKACWANGCDIEKTGSGHFKVLTADGQKIIILPSTPSDIRGLRNARALLRQAGIDLAVVKKKKR